MSAETLTASGGLAPQSQPVLLVPVGVRITPVRDAIPMFTASRGFEDPTVAWARKRELELRKLTQMWDWP